MKKIAYTLLLLLLTCATFAACGKKEEEIPNLMTDTRMVAAVEGRDYTIDYVKVAIADQLNENGSVIYTDYEGLKAELERRKELGEEIFFRVTVKYTALKELAGARVHMNLSFWAFDGGNHVTTFSDRNGNDPNETPEHSRTISPGEYYFCLNGSIAEQEEGRTRLDVIENLETLDDSLLYDFYVYAN